MYITIDKTTASAPIPDSYPLTDEQAAIVQANYPYFDLTIADGVITAVTPTAPPAPDLDPLKAAKIAETKNALEAYLAEHPLLWTDGKYYSVTAEKQTLLANTLEVYQIAVSAGQQPELTWNATGEECVVWAYADLCVLALGIAAFVKPLVAHQQALEVAIRAAATADELDAVVIDYALGN